MSDEHHLPECLGRFKNYKKLKNKVCQECNHLIGRELDEHFCYSGIEALYRFLLGIKGKKRQQRKSPFYRKFSRADKIIVKAKHPKEDFDIYCEPLEIFCKVFPARQIILRDHNEIPHIILIDDSIKEESDLLRELAKRNIAINNIKSFEVFCKDYEREFIERLLSIFRKKLNYSESPYQDQ
jgi:hypothetical protein